jgi:RNA exonuclease 1
MCYTAAGLEVARCSVVDAQGSVVYDTLVLPGAPITDYNTAHSGITAALMAGVTTRLADCQAALLALVAQETLLVGHSLENDLQALRLVHRAAVDTALLFSHPRGPPFKPALRVLSERLLGRRIQDGSHDSVADAAATMALARLKFAKGPAFGEPRADGVPLAELLGASGAGCALVDRPKALTRLATGAASAIAAAGDADAGAKAAREARKPLPGGPRLVWAHLADLGALQEARAQRARRRAEAPPDEEAAAAAAREEAAAEARALAAADAAVAAAHAAAPPGALLLVFSGHGDTAAARRLLESKFRRNQGLSGGPWGEDDEAALTRANDAARNGLLFFAVKP